MVLKTYLSFRRNAIAFMHPYCEQGGGGEVVLWKAVEALRERIKRFYFNFKTFKLHCLGQMNAVQSTFTQQLWTLRHLKKPRRVFVTDLALT